MNPLNEENTKGFIYGNVTLSDGSTISINEKNRVSMFIVPDSLIKTILVDSMYTVSCGTMLSNISQFAFEQKCMTAGKRSDLLRWIPCPRDKLCPEEDNPSLVIPGYQFTFRIEEPVSPEFWYVVFIACSLTQNCSWTSSIRDYVIDYDIWLVNGNPNAKGDVFLKQFSFEEQDIIHIYMVALQMYIILGLCQLRASSITKQSRLPRRQRLLNYIVMLKIGALIFQSTETFIFALFGRGTVIFMFVGELMRVFAVCLLCLLLILLSRGWSLNQRGAFTNRVKYLWILISTIHVVLFINGYTNSQKEWRSNGFDFLSNHAIVAIRLIQGAWFLFEVKRSILREEWEDRAVFLVHFGAAYMVWFVYLLGLGVISTMISELWRLKIVLAISTFANFVAIAFLVHIFWPTGSNRRFFSPDGTIHRHIERSSSTELDEYEKMLISNDGLDDDNEL